MTAAKAAKAATAAKPILSTGAWSFEGPLLEVVEGVHAFIVRGGDGHQDYKMTVLGTLADGWAELTVNPS